MRHEQPWSARRRPQVITAFITSRRIEARANLIRVRQRYPLRIPQYAIEIHVLDGPVRSSSLRTGNTEFDSTFIQFGRGQETFTFDQVVLNLDLRLTS